MRPVWSDPDPPPTSRSWSGGRNPSSRKKVSRHRIVVVLTRVDELGVEPRAQGGLQGRRLDELGSRPDDAEDAH